MKTWSEWWETHRGLFRSDVSLARKEIRDARDAQKDISKARVMVGGIENAFSNGKHERIEKAFHLYFIAMEHELDDLKRTVYEYKTLMRRALDELDELDVAVEENPKETQKEHLKEGINKIRSELKKEYTKFFQDLTSFESISLSAEQLLDEASLVRDLFYRAKQLRRAVKTFTRAYKQLLAEERAGKRLTPARKDEELKVIADSFRAELEAQRKGLQDLFQLLRNFEHHLGELKERIQELRAEEWYPKGWMGANFGVLNTLHLGLQGFLEREPKQARLFLSRLER